MGKEYDLDDFECIIDNGFVCTLPDETISIISALAEEVGAPTYVKTPVFEKRESQRKRRPCNHVVADGEWESIRQFKTTTIAKKEGVDKVIDDIRGIINKMSVDNFELRQQELCAVIDTLLDADDADTNMERVGSTLFSMVSGNKFYSELYARLYRNLMGKYDVFTGIFKKNFEQFLALFDDIACVNPDEDYDAYCANNRVNEQRKAHSMFFVNLMRCGIISHFDMIVIIEKLQSKINDYTGEAASVGKAEEVTENLFIIISNIKDELAASAASVNILKKIQQVADSEVTDRPSLSNKMIFKHMDLVDLLE